MKMYMKIFDEKHYEKYYLKDLSYKIDYLKVPTTYCIKIEEILE
jgi:hypothetical protein